MKSYGSEKCLPIDYYLKKPDSENDFESLLEGRGIPDRFQSPDLDLERVDRIDSEEEEGFLPSSNWKAKKREAEVVAAPVEDFEEDHITCYLKEVSSYPLLTQERETELAQIIRHGQDELVQIVQEHVAGSQDNCGP